MGMIRRFRILVAILTALLTSGDGGPVVASGGDGELTLARRSASSSSAASMS